MSSHSHEYLDRLYEILTSSEIELTPSQYRLFLEKSIDEIEIRLSDFTNSSDYDEYED